jgi:hypothetical protein
MEALQKGYFGPGWEESDKEEAVASSKRKV